MRHHTTAMLVAGLLLTASCTGGGTPRATTGSTPLITPPTTPQTTASTGGPTESLRVVPEGTRVPVLLVLVRRATTVELAFVGRDRRVGTFATIQPPDKGLAPTLVTASAELHPTVCVLWQPPSSHHNAAPSKGPGTLTCHRGPHLSQFLRRTTKSPRSLALTADARQLAWTEVTQGRTYATTALLVADVGTSSLEHERRAVSRKGCERECFEGRTPDGLAWAGNDLLLSMSCESDDGCDLRRLPTDDRHLAVGWDAGSTAIPPGRREPTGYRYFDRAGTAVAGTALAVERSSSSGEQSPAPPDRAVRVDLRSGNTLQVLATASRDRLMAGVSGGAAGVVYGTATSLDPGTATRYSVRFPEDRKGSLLVRLPADTQEVVAVPR